MKTHFFNCRATKNGGGVAIFVEDSYFFEKRDDLSINSN